MLRESQVAFSPYYRVAFFEKKKGDQILSAILLFFASVVQQMDAITINNFQVVYTQLHSFMFLQRSTFVLLFFTTTTAKKCSFEFSKTTYQGGEKMQSNNVASVSSFFDIISSQHNNCQQQYNFLITEYSSCSRQTCLNCGKISVKLRSLLLQHIISSFLTEYTQKQK